MKRKLLLLCLPVFFVTAVRSQTTEEKKVAAASESFRKALVDADKKMLDALTAEHLSYGHSSGKVEDKAAFIDAVMNGPVDFISIDITDETIRITGDDAVVRHTFYTKMKREGKDDEIKISVLQVWQHQKGTWKLLARQAVKIQ